MKTLIPTITLSNGVHLPAIGLGVFQTPAAETVNAVESPDHLKLRSCATLFE